MIPRDLAACEREWLGSLTDSLIRARRGGMTFAAAWDAALREHPIPTSGWGAIVEPKHGDVETPLTFTRRHFEDAWYRRDGQIYCQHEPPAGSPGCVRLAVRGHRYCDRHLVQDRERVAA